MFFPFFRRNKFFNFIGEKDNSNFIIILNCRECKCRCNFCHYRFFHFTHRTKVSTGRYIYQQHYRKFSLFFKNFYIRLIMPGGYIPVDIAYIITILIFPDFRESHTSPLKSRMVLSCKNITGQSPGFYFDLTNFF